MHLTIFIYYIFIVVFLFFPLFDCVLSQIPSPAFFLREREFSICGQTTQAIVTGVRSWRRRAYDLPIEYSKIFPGSQTCSQ
ncbi:hypothetical protein O6P43_009655 [Quillaja saponaria]|uniref:Uncharacterized protein n=1 Tax=Quillaja saponaria TaxID=32244 RepID=A0AAD7PYT2_QUISA|nr:hypothetical protein O6P43_009655 [Quillaja saponaria]